MKDKSAGNNQAGISTLEVLIAMAILVTTLSTVILVVFGNQDVTVSSQNDSIALYRASQIMEKAKAQGMGDFNNLTSSSSMSIDNVFDEELLVTDVNPCKKNVTSQVGWSLGSAVPQEIEINSVISNPAEAFALGGDCGSNNPPITEWWYPLTYKDYDLKTIEPPALQSGNAGVGATSIDIIEKGSKFAILTTNHSSEKDLWIINVDDGQNAFIVSSLETGVAGLNNADVYLAGNYVFALTEGSYNTEPSELQIMDISTIGAPSLVATRSLGISGADSSNTPNASAIYYYGGKVYVGSHRTGGDEFQIFSATAPFNLLGSLEITHNVNDIIVSGDYAYLATSDDGNELMVIDISNPSNLTHPNPTDPLGQLRYDAAGNYDAISLDLLSNKIYLGRVGGNYAKTDAQNFMILNVDDPNSIALLGAKFIQDNAGPNKAAGILATNIVGTFAFIATDDSDTDFQVFRIGNPANIYNCAESPPSGVSFDPPGCGLYNFPQNMVDLEYYDNYIYAAISANATFRIIFDDESKY